MTYITPATRKHGTPGHHLRHTSHSDPAGPNHNTDRSNTATAERNTDNAEARALIGEAAGQRSQAQAQADAQQEASWRERALNAEAALKTAHAEIRAQRERIAALMGQIRDLEHEWPQETAQRVITENTTLKQRVRQLTQDNRTLEERLQAARSNNRFADRRIAQLEAQIVEDAKKR